jgi:phenylalanine-4-hydroxylase
MAFRIGGLSSLLKAIECENVTTSQLSSGLQISGIFMEAIKNGDNQPAYIKTKGPTALAYKNKEISGQGKGYHQDGFGTPVGSLKDSSTPLERMSDGDLGLLKIEVGKSAELTFESGVSVKGNLDKIERKDGRILLMKFSDCKVTRGNQLLFDPAWGTYDMAVGEKVTSVFCGAADKEAFEQVPLVPKERTIKIQYDAKTVELQQLYQKIRIYREQGGNEKVLSEVRQELQKNHPQDWLLSLEILEILAQRKLYPDLEEEIRAGLQEKAVKRPELAKLIKDGLNLVYGPQARVAKEKR